MVEKELKSKPQVKLEDIPHSLHFDMPIDKKAYAEFLSHDCDKRAAYNRSGIVVGCKYIIAPGAIGDVILVECNCGLLKDITNSDCW